MTARGRGFLMGTMLLACGMVACGSARPKGELLLAGQPIDVETMTAAEVERAVVVADGADGTRRYRAPTLRLVQSVDLSGRGGPVVPSRVGVVEIARAGFLVGTRGPGSATVRHALVYRSDVVRGEHRYAQATLADGRELRFRSATASPSDCEPDCFSVIQSVTAELPEDALRAAAETGLTVTLTLDNGHAFPVRAPAAYVQGYLDAVQADPTPGD